MRKFNAYICTLTYTRKMFKWYEKILMHIFLHKNIHWKCIMFKDYFMNSDLINKISCFKKSLCIYNTMVIRAPLIKLNKHFKFKIMIQHIIWHVRVKVYGFIESGVRPATLCPARHINFDGCFGSIWGQFGAIRFCHASLHLYSSIL